MSISSSILKIDTQKNMLWASRDIKVMYRKQEWAPGKLFVDLDLNEVYLRNLNVLMVNPASKYPIYMRVKEMKLLEDYQFGRELYLSTCVDDPPHYAFTARQFFYYPDQYILAKDVTIRHEFLGVPISVWFPYYKYEIGKRNMIWNIPIIGRKETPGWGWFVQNTIDYDVIDGRLSSLYLDVFQGKGVGAGVKHQFSQSGHSGNVQYYRLDELDSGRLNEKIGLTDGFWITPQLGVTVNYQKVNAERINASGRQSNEVKDVGIVYDLKNERYDVSLRDNQDDNQKIRVTGFDLKHQSGKQDDYVMSVTQKDNDAALRKDLDLFVQNKAVFFTDMAVQTQFQFNKQKLFLKPEDQRLESRFSLSKPLNNSIQIAMRVDHLLDLDRNQISTNNALNRYFFRLPEVTITHKPDLKDFSLSQTFTIARYQEVEFQNQSQVLRTFPKDQDFNFAPNTYAYSHVVSKTFSDAKPNTFFKLSSGFSQYVFQTPGRTLLDGDAFYTFDLSAKHSFEWTKGWIIETGYSSVYAPKENNSPFYYFNDRIQAQNIFSEKWTFYWADVSRYQWTHETGFDMLNQRWQDYRTQLTLKPSYWVFVVNTGKKLSPLELELQKDFYPFVFSSTYTHPGQKTKLGFSIAFDTNQWVYNRQTVIQSSFASLSTPFGSTDPNDQWEAAVALAYQNPAQSTGFSVDRYQIQTFQITKHDHCRSFTLSYNKLTEEISFRYTIDAFPDDSLEVIKSRESWRLGGQLNMASQERF